MKKRKIAKSINFLDRKGKLVNATICLHRFAIALVVVAFILPANNQVLADKKIKPGKKQATLILSDGRKIVLGTKSDTIVNSKTKGVRIKVDSTGINYITIDNKNKIKKNEPVKKN
ncbi:hypothetical protein ACT3CE_04695 [Marinifilum sp. RC60d5]|uniref:hypothetical protein n=1 Tax=Marinifilum sp. RC60d5 TaxID=3458414 RepID=UPI004037249A